MQLVTRLCQAPRWVHRGGQWRLDNHGNSTDLDARTEHGDDTLLHLAAARGKYGVVTVLVSKGKCQGGMTSNGKQRFSILHLQLNHHCAWESCLISDLDTLSICDTFQQNTSPSCIIPF